KSTVVELTSHKPSRTLNQVVTACDHQCYTAEANNALGMFQQLLTLLSQGGEQTCQENQASVAPVCQLG
ncbi:MAG: hypothetical protein ACKO9I_14005, partial [Sphaerospermopsis kisseleviana]